MPKTCEQIIIIRRIVRSAIPCSQKYLQLKKEKKSPGLVAGLSNIKRISLELPSPDLVLQTTRAESRCDPHAFLRIRGGSGALQRRAGSLDFELTGAL